MNGTNILANVDVPHVEANFADMYQLQYELQERLKQLPQELDYMHMAQKCIYWGHCIRAEVVELIEWLANQKDPSWVKELQMEAIDIVHFVFNLGLEIGLTTDSIQCMEQEFEHYGWNIAEKRLHAASIMLETSIINFINMLPWKTWKNYKELPDLAAIGEKYAIVFKSCLLLCNAAGLDQQGIINMYCAKNKVNHVRQDNGY